MREILTITLTKEPPLLYGRPSYHPVPQERRNKKTARKNRAAAKLTCYYFVPSAAASSITLLNMFLI